MKQILKNIRSHISRYALPYFCGTVAVVLITGIAVSLYATQGLPGVEKFIAISAIGVVTSAAYSLWQSRRNRKRNDLFLEQYGEALAEKIIKQNMAYERSKTYLKKEWRQANGN